VRERILITGPGGRVGAEILHLLREHFALRLFDAKLMMPVDDDETMVGDVQDFAALQRACTGVQAVIHLAAISDEADFHTKLLPVNLAGTYNAFEAARLAGVKKFIYPSTGQTVLNNPKGTRVTTDMLPRPSTVYACTKLFGEALARHYSDIHDMSCIVIRLCYFRGYNDPLLRIPGHGVQSEWCSPRDLTQLLTKSIHSDLKFGIFFGLSDNTERRWDIDNARAELGYVPEDNAATFLR